MVPNEEIRRQGTAHARRSPVLEARHYRLELRARRLQPADHPRPRRQPRRHRRERHRRRRRLRSRRRPFRADRSARDQPGRSHPRPGGAALRLDLDRRRRQRDQQPHPGCAAHLRRRRRSRATDCRRRRRWRTRNHRPASTVETRTAVSSVDRGVEGGILLDAGGGNFAVPCRRLWPQGQRLQHPELSLSVRPDPAGQRPAAEFGDAGGWRVDRRLLHLPGRLHRRGDHAERLALSHPRHRRRRSPDPDRRATRPNSPPRANTGRMPRRSTPSASGPAPPTIKHNEIGLADPADPSTARRAADLHQQGAGRPRSKCR